MQPLGLEEPAAIGVVSRLVTLDHGLPPFAVVRVAGQDADEERQSVRVRQDVHLGIRLAAVHGWLMLHRRLARDYETKPGWSPIRPHSTCRTA
jgi:hypothetical protein